MDSFGLTAIAINGVEIDVPASGDLLPGEAVYRFIIGDHGNGGKL